MQWVVDRPQRLVDFIKARVADDASIKAIRRALDKNACRVNGKVERFASKKVFLGDKVLFAPVSQEKKEPISLPVIFEDEWMKVVNKPSGWVCEDAALRRLLGPNHWLIHRLDKETSGLLLIAKSLLVKEQFIALFEKKAVSKLYAALVDGICRWRSLKKESWLVRQKAFAGQTIWGSLPLKHPGALYACTHLETVEVGKKASLVACRPETGRTHQIRVHLAELGHPILIDRQYASSFSSTYPCSRIMLHASRLSFIHPMTQEKIGFFAPLPGDMRSAIDLAGISSQDVSEFFMKQDEKGSGNKSDDDEQPKEMIELSCCFDQSCQ